MKCAICGKNIIDGKYQIDISNDRVICNDCFFNPAGACIC